MSKAMTNIVIIDDDSCHNIICALSLKNAFKPLNLNIVGFTNVKEGIHYLVHNVPKNKTKTVLFLDINMPGISGWDVLNKIELMPEMTRKNLVVYMLSTYLDHADKERAFTFSCVKDCLSKPLSDHLLQISEEITEMNLLQNLVFAGC